MPPKKKEETVDASSLPPWFPLCVYISPEASEQNSKIILKRVHEGNFTTKRLITREEIIEYGKKNGMYVDPTQDAKKKDKNAAEAPTELTPELLAKMFVKFYEEINVEERKEKKARLDAIADGKDPASLKKADAKKPDPKAQKDAKKGDKKDPKAKVEEEEQKEEPPLPLDNLKRECDFVYFLVDYPTTKPEIDELVRQGGKVDLLLILKETVKESKSFMEENINLRDEEDDNRARFEKFMGNQGSLTQRSGEDGKKDKLSGAERLAADKEFIKQNAKITESYKANRRESKGDHPIRNTMIKEILCEFDPAKTPDECFREFTMQIYTEICTFSQDVVAYREWLQKQKAVNLKPSKQAEIEAAEAAAKAKALLEAKAEEEKPAKSPRPGDPKDAKKDAKDVKKKVEPAKKEEQKVEEAPPAKPEPPKVEEKEIEIPFNFYEKQLNPVKEQHLTPGALLEALVDEISHLKKNAKSKQELSKVDIESIFNNFDNDVLKEISSIKPLPNRSTTDLKDMSSPYHYIINEGDLIAIRSQQDQLSSQETLDSRVHLSFDRLKVPGLNREGMPAHPEKPEPIRKAEKSQIYPFISFDISDYERFHLLETYEKMFQEKTPREWDFGDRVYEEKLNANLLRQKLYQSLLFDPEVFAQYNDKDDALMLGIYFVNPPGRIIRKKWTCPWKVLPNVENWIKHFKGNENNLKNKFYYDLDYQIIEGLHEVIKFMYPNDLSVIMCSQFQVGDRPFYFYRILKENLIFGIRKSIKAENPNSELWAVFENRTKLLVEIEKLTSDAKKAQIKESEDGDEDEKPAENVHHEELGKNCQCEICAARKLAESKLEEYGATFTLTLENGLIVKFLTNGDILQTIVRSKKNREGKYFDEIIKEQYVKEELAEQERSRLITGKGSVIRYMKDGSTQIMYANGNYAYFKKNSGTWVTTNNKGLRKGRKLKDGSEFELEPIPSAKKTDPETGCKILIREDKVMVIQYPDGHLFTTHKDGTRFLTSPDLNTIVIEHDDFATVRIKYDPIKARMGTIIARGSSTAYQGFENIMDRSYDGRVTETFVPDGSRVVGYREKRELEGYEQYEISNLHLLYEPEGSVLRLKSTGEVIIISANDRYELNRTGENREKDDIDYFIQLYGIPEDRKNGVYTAELTQNVIWTRDNEANYFSISSNGEVKGKIAVSFDLNQNINEPDKPAPDNIPDGLYIEPENGFLPPPEKVLPPKLFLIKNDNTGLQLMNDLELNHYFRTKENDGHKCTKIVENEAPGLKNCQSHTFLTNFNREKLKLIARRIPSNVDIIPQTESIREEPLKQKFLYRNLLKFSELDESNRQKLHDDLEKYNEWKANLAKQAKGFGIKDRSEEHKDKVKDKCLLWSNCLKEYSIQQRLIDAHRAKA